MLIRCKFITLKLSKQNSLNMTCESNCTRSTQAHNQTVAMQQRIGFALVQQYCENRNSGRHKHSPMLAQTLFDTKNIHVTLCCSRKAKWKEQLVYRWHCLYGFLGQEFVHVLCKPKEIIDHIQRTKFRFWVVCCFCHLYVTLETVALSSSLSSSSGRGRCHLFSVVVVVIFYFGFSFSFFN